jgi:hypothetical protein
MKYIVHLYSQSYGVYIKIVVFVPFSVHVKQLEDPERIFTKLDIREFY